MSDCAGCASDPCDCRPGVKLADIDTSPRPDLARAWQAEWQQKHAAGWSPMPGGTLTEKGQPRVVSAIRRRGCSDVILELERQINRGAQLSKVPE